MDHSFLVQIDKEKVYWRAVLKRVVAVVKFLCEKDLPFRGENEVFGSPQNGNLLALLELLAQFDDFPADHIRRFGNSGRGVPLYLSSTICNEFVQLGSYNKIANEVKKAKYYSITVDSSSVVTHVDQLTFIIRYVQDDGTIVERLLKFIDSNGQHDAKSITNHISLTPTEIDINLDNCRGQSYDNASNLSGKYTGVRARFIALNPLIHYIPCTAHPLNLIGSCAAESCINAVPFFGFLQNFYKFFSASTKRWAKMKSAIKGKTVKSLSNTRWSARSDATTSLKENFVELRQMLQNFTLDDNETNETKSDLSYVKKSLDALEAAMLCALWHKIFQRFHSISSLQRTDMSSESCVALYNGIESFCQHEFGMNLIQLKKMA